MRTLILITLIALSGCITIKIPLPLLIDVQPVEIEEDSRVETDSTKRNCCDSSDRTTVMHKLKGWKLLLSAVSPLPQSRLVS